MGQLINTYDILCINYLKYISHYIIPVCYRQSIDKTWFLTPVVLNLSMDTCLINKKL